MVCTVFVYSTYRDIKDAMVVGAAKALGIKAGNVMTNWLKVVGVLPGSLLFTSGLLALTSHLRFPTVFYIVTAFFGFYFALNAWILYPNRQDLMFHSLIERMKKIDGEDNFWLQLELGILGIFAFPVTSMH
jgi:ATP/ADP translocase